MPVALVDWPSTFGKRPGYVTPRSPVLSLGRARRMARKRSTAQTPLLDIPRPLPPPPLPDLHQRLRATLDAAQWGLSHAVHLESRSEEHTSELQSHSFISYAVFCLKKK